MSLTCAATLEALSLLVRRLLGQSTICTSRCLLHSSQQHLQPVCSISIGLEYLVDGL